MTQTTMCAAEMCKAAGLPVPGSSAGYVQKREVSRGLTVLDSLTAETLGAWQAPMCLVEEEWRRRERSPWGYRWETRSQRYLLVAEGDRVHRHPVPRTVAGVRAAIAWMLEVPVTALSAIDRVQGDVYVLRREGAARRLRSRDLPPRHVAEERTITHPVHATIPAHLAGEEIIRTCRSAAVTSAYAAGATRD